MIKILIAEDIQILRQGLKAILSQDTEMEVIGMAANGMEALEFCRNELPDVVLMDMRMPDYDGVFGTQKIKAEFPQVKVLVLTTFDDQETVDSAVRSGADGYILKEMEDEHVIQSVKAVSHGIRVFGQSVFENIKNQMQSHSPLAESVGLLTLRERDILRCIAGGRNNKEISADLYLAEGTVRNHISRILEKLKLKDRTQLAVFAIKNDLD